MECDAGDSHGNVRSRSGHSNPELVVTGSYPWFVRYGVRAALLAVTVLCVRWYRKATGLTRQLRALEFAPNTDVVDH